MVSKVVMPRLSLTMKEGTVVQWFKKEGETVQKGEPLVEVLSEKVTYDVEVPESGILRKILAGEGSDVPIDQTIGIITAPTEAFTEEEIIPKSILPSRQEPPSTPKPEIEIEPTERVPASPAAKRLAKELGVNLVQVIGTGEDGRITEEDVSNFAQKTESKLKVKETHPLTGIRKTTAERLSLSARTAPHSTVIMEVDMTNAAKLHGEKNFSYTDMLIKAVASALKEHPLLNSTLENEQIKVYEDVNIGVAVATEKGLIVPVIHNADMKSINEISTQVKDLIEKAKQGKLSKEDLTDGTFTITNLGMYGVDVFIPIINPPEAAILGCGRITEKPSIADNQIQIRPIMQLSLAYDHRIVDGAPAAQYLLRIKQILEVELANK